LLGVLFEKSEAIQAQKESRVRSRNRRKATIREDNESLVSGAKVYLQKAQERQGLGRFTTATSLPGLDVLSRFLCQSVRYN
jgi:hypothetical protein